MSERIADGYCPEGVDYLPGFFRGPVAEDRHHPVRCLLEAFEANLHLVERIIETSYMLFDPEESPLFADKVRPPTLAVSDLVDAQSLSSKLQHPADKVSQFLWNQFSQREQNAISGQISGQADLGASANALVEALNRIILGRSIDDPERFAEVKFSTRTRSLRASADGRTKRSLLNRLLLQDAFPYEIRALPETPELDQANWKAAWLQYLASYIDLDLDQEWLGRADAQGAGTMPGQTDEDAAPRSARAAAAFQQAPALYRQRGTPTGLVNLLHKLHGWDVEVLEHSWPAGMQIEICSTIGEDTWLMDPLDQDRHFVVLLQPTESNLDRLGLQDLRTITKRLEFKLIGKAAGRHIEALQVPSQGGGETRPIPPSLEAAKLQNVIDQEKPAHTRYYLALEASGEQQPKPILLPLVIESDSHTFTSILEHFWIN